MTSTNHQGPNSAIGDAEYSAEHSGSKAENPQPDNNRPRSNGGGDRETSAEIAAKYVARGWKVIPIRHGQKGPRGNDWQSRTYDPLRDFDGKNIGVQLGPVSDGLTDVDLDCVEAIKLAPYLLPPTPAIFGRQSKQRSHWLYNTDDPDPDKATIKIMDSGTEDDTRNKKAIIELRMGGAKGAQTVFPGSTHECGEKIEWATNGKPAKSSCVILKDRVTKIAIGSLLARHLPLHGTRHEATLRCGGFLARAGWEPEFIEEFMGYVQNVAGVTDPSSIKDGCRAAYDAAIGFQNGEKVYGFPAMVEIFGEKVCKRIAELLHYREYPEVDKQALIERMNENHCIIPYGNKVRIVAFKYEMNRRVLIFYNQEDFKLLYANLFVTGSDGKPKSVGLWWLQHPERRQYAGLRFEPGPDKPQVIEESNGTYLNLWGGWGIDEPRKGSWRLLRRHIYKVLSKRDKKVFKYIIRWTAWTFQNLDKQAEAAIAFRDKEGTGKGVYGRTICKICGQHGLQISDGKHLTGTFNKHLLDCVILFADEAFWPGDKTEGTLKRIITEPTLPIEPKHVDLEMHPNLLHIILATNKEWVVPAGIEARRFGVFDVSEEYMGNKEYFRALYQEIENGGAAAMLYDLLRMDLNGWHPRDDIPKTEALRDQKLLSLSPEDQWWYGLLEVGQLCGRDFQTPGRNSPVNPRRARSRFLYDAARQRVPRLRFYSDTLLGRILRAQGCKGCRIDGQRAWEFPALAEARKAWNAKMPGTEWDLGEEWEIDDVAVGY
jgi:hypothetical protein